MTVGASDSQQGAARILSALLEARTGQTLSEGRAWRMETALRPVLRDHGLDDIDALTARLLRKGDSALEQAVVEALPDCLDRPFAFFGHSLGATVAYEVALRSEESPERRPLRLFASAKSAPCVPRRHHIDRLDDESLIREIDKLGGISPGTLNDPGFRGLFLPTVRADYRAVETYSPAPGTRVSCPITVFIGGSDPLVPVADATAWDLHTSKGTDTKVFEGGHFYLDENVPEVAAAVLGALTMSSGEEGGRPAAGEPPNHALTYGL